MRLGAWLCAALPLLAGACSGGYPLEPTACDDWCDATKGASDFSCEYDPAGCVSQCEAQQLDRKECRPVYDVAVECYRTTPGAATPRCDYPYDLYGMSMRPCQNESFALMTCSGAYLVDIDANVPPIR